MSGSTGGHSVEGKAVERQSQRGKPQFKFPNNILEKTGPVLEEQTSAAWGTRLKENFGPAKVVMVVCKGSRLGPHFPAPGQSGANRKTNGWSRLAAGH